MKQKIQHILFPDDDALFSYREMFYRGSKGVLTEESVEGYLCLNKYETVEFCTYFNSVSYGKWRKYTSIKEVFLFLEIQGNCEITLCGYSLVNDVPKRVALGRKRLSGEERTKICLEFPENQEQLLGFEIKTYGEIRIFGGYYEGEFDEETVNPVELALATTTCWKEDFIKKNIARLKAGVLDGDDEFREHFRIHIVDNGRTLKREDFPEDERIHYHPNKNTGGSGGYARGMIECLHQEPKPTHVLLMDDDVMILPDSIFRTYVLLKYVREEYRSSFISGAMLTLEKMNIQHEDIGSVDDMGTFAPLKPKYDHFRLHDNLQNEESFQRKNVFQGWWYCCIPIQVIEKEGLPLPLFIRADDMEYSLRCKAQMISMNGICIWHMGFYGKYSASMSLYQECRNMLIAQATTGVLPDANLIGRIKKFYRDNMLKHDYNAAELLLRALEDFMKGPEFIMKDKGEKIVKENGKLNQRMEPLEHLEREDVDVYMDPYEDNPRKFLKKWLYRFTYNGHRLCPAFLLDKTPAVIPFDFGYTPGKMEMKKTYIAVNPAQRNGCVKEIDKKRFKELQERYKRDLWYFAKHEKEIRERYRRKKEVLISEDFWKGYLGI